MIKNETRESAHLKSRVKDLSVVPNLVSFTGLFTAITPIAKLDKNPDTGFYDPILIRDTDSLIANFGDPRIDPEKYIDLYTIMQVIGNGTSCYVCKVDSGDTGIYEFAFIPEDSIIDNHSTGNEEDDRTIIDDDIAKITDRNGHPLDPTDNARLDPNDIGYKPHEKSTKLEDVSNKYVLSKLFGYISAKDATAAHDANSYITAKGDYLGTRGNDLHVVVTGTAAVEGHPATSCYDSEIVGDYTITCTAADAGTAYGYAVVVSNNNEEHKLHVNIMLGGTNVADADVSYEADATSVTLQQINEADITGTSDKVNKYVSFSMNNGEESVSSLQLNLLDSSLSFVLANGQDLVEDSNADYTVKVYDLAGKGEDVSIDDLEPDYTRSNVASPNDVSDNAYITISTLSALNERLTGGEDDAVPPREWELVEGSYKVDFVEKADDGNDGTKTFDIVATVDDSNDPERLIVKYAALDPEYGRENIELDSTPWEPQSDSDKAKYKDKTVFNGKDLLDRKYTIMSVKDGDALVGSDMYTVEWFAEGGKYRLRIAFDKTLGVTDPAVVQAARQTMSIIAYSSMSEPLNISCTLTQAKPYSLKLFYLNVAVASGKNTLGTAKVKLEPTTTNQSLVNNLNSSLQTYARFELADPDTKSACEVKESGKNSIVKALLDTYAPVMGKTRENLVDNPTSLPEPTVMSQPKFKVMLQNYIDAQMQYKDKKYVGCLMADFTAPVSCRIDPEDSDKEILMVEGNDKAVMPLDPDERRALHYNLKQIACERKDSTVIISTPLTKGHEDPNTWFTMDEACNWVASQGDYADLWEYGAGNTVDYSIQSFYLEIYYSWLNLQCTKIDNGLANQSK